MAFTNQTRVGHNHKKMTRSLMSINIDANTAENYVQGNHLVAYLPENAVITDAYLAVDVAIAATIALGTTEGGTEILSLADGSTLGTLGTFTGRSLTRTGKPVYMTVSVADAVAGKAYAVIEYDEPTLNCGDLTVID